MSRRLKSFLGHASLAALLASNPVCAAAESVLRAPPHAQSLQDALLSVILNGERKESAAQMLRDSAGGVYATEKQLRDWRVTTPDLPSVERSNVRYYLLNAIPGTSLSLDEASQSLRIDVAPGQLQTTRISYAAVPVGDKLAGGTGAYVNYDVSLQTDGSSLAGAASAEAVVFAAAGVGSSTVVARTIGGTAELTRLETSWTIDDPERMRSLRIGDSVSRGGVGGSPFRFAGLQLATNFSVQPGFVTMPLPSLSGSAELPSAIELYVNNVLVRKSDVRAGPFDVIDVPIVTGDGDVQLVVRDMLGRQQRLSQRYYQAKTQLRAGLDDYSYQVGFLRRSFGRDSNDYGQLIFSGTHRHGISNRLTGEAHVQATRETQQAGVGASVVVPALGQFAASAAVSRSNAGMGVSGSINAGHNSRFFSVGLHAEFESRNYRTASSLPGAEQTVSVIQAFAGIPLPGNSLGLSYLRRDARNAPDIEFASANWSTRLGDVGTLSLAARTSLRGEKDTAAEIFLTLPLGQRTSARMGTRYDKGERSLAATVQRSPPMSSGIGYRFEASVGRFKRANAQILLRTSLADYDGELTWVEGQAGIRLSTSGTAGFAGGGGFASRRVDQSFARVKVGNYPGVRVYSENQLVGRTDGHGSILVPGLRAYDRNIIRIDPADLPLDAELGSESKAVRPHDRHGVSVDFAAKPARAALLKVLLEDGSLLPSGSAVTVAGKAEESVSGPGGQVYLTGVNEGAVAEAKWSGGTCRFSVPSAAAAGVAAAVRCAGVVG